MRISQNKTYKIEFFASLNGQGKLVKTTYDCGFTSLQNMLLRKPDHVIVIAMNVFCIDDGDYDWYRVTNSNKLIKE